MKAESVAGDETGALAGREGSDTLALAGRGGVGTHALAGRGASDTEAPTRREGSATEPPTGREATDAEARTGRDQADAEAGRERADTAERGQDHAAEHERPEADDAAAEPEGAGTLAGRKQADADDVAKRGQAETGDLARQRAEADAAAQRGQAHANALTRRKGADSDDLTEREQSDADALAEREDAGTSDVAGREHANTDALDGQKHGHTDGRAEREHADTDDVAGRERADTAVPKGPERTESGVPKGSERTESGSGAASGSASGEADSGSGARTASGSGERLDADGASGRRAERGGRGDARAVDAGARSQEAEGGGGARTPADKAVPVDVPGGAGPASADSSGDGAEEQEASAEPTPPGTGRRSEETAPQGGDQSGAKAPKATAEGGPDAARRPSWAKRDDTRPSGPDRRAAQGEEAPEGAGEPQDKTDTPARRPSWAHADDRPEKDGAPGEGRTDTRRTEVEDKAGPGGRQPGEGDETSARRKPQDAAPAAEEPTSARRAPAQDDQPTRPAPKAADTARAPQGAPSSRQTPARDDEPTQPVPKHPGAAPGSDKPTGSRPAQDDQPTRPAPKAAGTARAPEGAPNSRQTPARDDESTRPAPNGPRVDGAAGSRTESKAAGAACRAVAGSDDPERTSEFVALKDPRAARPAPTPWPEVIEPTRETPRPPLDLLAELTNTGPATETPRRTLTRRVKVWTPIVLLLGGAVVGGQMLRPLPDAQLVSAQGSVTLDGQLSIPWPAKGQGAVRIAGSGDVATFGEQKPTPTASVAKAMTAYLILKDHPLRKGEQGPQIEIDAQAAAESASGDESRIKYLKAGQKFSQREMLEMVMLPSANNIARLLARWDGGSGGEAAFVAKMNGAARDLGMRDTTYTDPSGLNATTVSTAVDQLKLAEAAMQDETFRAVVETKTKTIKGVVDGLENSNKLLWAKELGNKGIKTGSSTAAGGTLVWAADKQIGEETPLILGALMEQRADGPDVNGADSLALVLANTRPINETVRKALAATPVIHKGQTVGHVSDGLGGRTPLVATKDLSVIGVPGQKLRLTLGTAGGRSVPHEAGSGTEVAVLTVGEGPGAKTVPVAVGTRLATPSFGTRVTRLS
ncbi:hypothetical protein [Streptomyces sp. NPDC089915]|uniref:hypothetical protein n=1 Tax=Streptomyces sp. NPDC089915 TaxID=3155186 RepID=UPI003447D6A9